MFDTKTDTHLASVIFTYIPGWKHVHMHNTFGYRITISVKIFDNFSHDDQALVESLGA